MSSDKKKRGLGRGLSALMADVNDVPAPDADGAEQAGEMKLPIEKIHPNPDQPRRQFEEEALDELSKSIAARGLIQPIIVRPSKRTDGEYEIVAGERRWRASQRASLHEVPVVVRDFDDLEMLEAAIVENVQREDLSAVEEARSYQQLMERFKYTQEQVASGLGKSRSHIANTVRLLSLPEQVLRLIDEGALSAGHARTVIGKENAVQLAQKIVDQGLTVRQAEKLASADKAEKPVAKRASASKSKDADTLQLERDLSANLSMKVSIDDSGNGKGRVSIAYETLDALDDLLNLLTRG